MGHSFAGVMQKRLLTPSIPVHVGPRGKSEAVGAEAAWSYPVRNAADDEGRTRTLCLCRPYSSWRSSGQVA